MTQPPLHPPQPFAQPDAGVRASFRLLLVAWLVNVAALVTEITAAALFLSALSAELDHRDGSSSLSIATTVAVAALVLAVGGVVLTATTVVRYRKNRPVAVPVLAAFTAVPAFPLFYAIGLVIRTALGR